ncbi:MAG: hypothetical protein OEZ34_06215 [Spirochaetia bacterium]|nr:hypothetical protein [Spirochaetia bacterium]
MSAEILILHIQPVMNSEKIIQIQNFSLLSGMILFIVSGSILLFLIHQMDQNKSLEKHLAESSEKDFVLIERPLKKRFAGVIHYYYSYSGQYNGRSYSRIERVDQDYFHLVSPGKNVEIKIYKDPAGNLHTLLLGNQIPYGRNLNGVMFLSKIFVILGLAMAISGSIMRIFSGSFTEETSGEK